MLLLRPAVVNALFSMVLPVAAASHHRPLTPQSQTSTRWQHLTQAKAPLAPAVNGHRLALETGQDAASVCNRHRLETQVNAGTSEIRPVAWHRRLVETDDGYVWGACLGQGVAIETNSTARSGARRVYLWLSEEIAQKQRGWQGALQPATWLASIYGSRDHSLNLRLTGPVVAYGCE